MIEWRVFYSDLTTHDSDMGLRECPSRDCQWIVIYRDEYPGYAHLTGADIYFYLRDEGWYGADWTGYLDHSLLQVHRIDKVLLGRHVPDDQWRKVKAQVEIEVDEIRKTYEST